MTTKEARSKSAPRSGESGTALPHSKTLAREHKRIGIPQGLGVRQCYAAFLVLVVAALLPLAGCGKSDSGVTVTESKLGPDGVDVGAVQKAFESASQGLRFAVDDALQRINAGTYGDAIPALQKLAENPKTTPEQKQALEGLIQKLKTLPASRATP